MKRMIFITIVVIVMTGCTDKDDPQPCKNRQKVYDRVEMEKVRVKI